MSETHVLKCWPEYFRAIERGDKTFEVRRDDRGFQKGDLLHLQEWNPKAAGLDGEKYTGRELLMRITYVLTGGQFGIEPGYVVMGLALETNHDR